MDQEKENNQPSNKTADERSCNLWRCVMIVGGCLMHLTLGSMLTYGNLSSYMISYIRTRSSPSDLRYVDGVWVLSCIMIGNGITMFTGGLIERKLGPRITAVIGSLTMSSGVLLSYFTIQHSFIATVFTYGVMSGLGMGIVYPIPLGCALKWFPHRRGLITAVIIAAFSSGILVFNQVITAYINPDNYSPDEEVAGEQYFRQDEVLDRVPYCFLILGGIYVTLQLVCSLVMIDPPKEIESIQSDQDSHRGDVRNTTFDSDITTEFSTDTTDRREEIPKTIVEVTEVQQEEIPPLKALKTKNFYLLWVIFLCGGEGSIFISAQYKNYGQTFISDDLFLSVVGSVASVVSGVGCIFWGFIMDRFSFKVVCNKHRSKYNGSVLKIFARQDACNLLHSVNEPLDLVFPVASRGIYLGAGCLIASFLATEYAGKIMFFIWVCLMYFHFGGIFTIMAPAISRLYGNKYVATNYGLLFTSQIITGATSAFLGQALQDAIGWNGLFFLSTGLYGVGILLIFFVETKTPAGYNF